MAEDAGKAGDIAFTAGETALLVAIMQNLTSDIQFDSNAVAEKLGYKDGGIVKTRWSQIKRKKINSVAARGTATTATAAGPAGVKKRISKKSAKAVVAAAAADDDEETVAETPVKTPAKQGRKPKAKEESLVEGEDEEKDEIKVEDEF